MSVQYHQFMSSQVGPYIYVSEFSAVVMVHWYTTSFTKHSPFKGHLFGSLQLQGLGGVSSSDWEFCLENGLVVSIGLMCFELDKQL